MGALIIEIKKINKNISNLQKRQEQIKKITQKKEQEKEQKEYEKGLLIACEEDLRNSMNRVFERLLEENGSNKQTLDLVLMQYYNVNTRNACINEFGKTTAERNHIDKIYDKTLKEVFNKWEKHVEYCQLQVLQKDQNLKELQREKLEKEIKRKVYYKILTIIAVVLFVISLIFKWFLLLGISISFLIYVLKGNKKNY